MTNDPNAAAPPPDDTGMPAPEAPNKPRQRLRYGLWTGAIGCIVLAAIVYFLFVR